MINGMEKEKNIITKGESIFEGEYLNDKRWNGKLKEYNFNGILKLKGEYLNGKVYINKKRKHYDNK